MPKPAAPHGRTALAKKVDHAELVVLTVYHQGWTVGRWLQMVYNRYRRAPSWAYITTAPPPGDHRVDAPQLEEVYQSLTHWLRESYGWPIFPNLIVAYLLFSTSPPSHLLLVPESSLFLDENLNVFRLLKSSESFFLTFGHWRATVLSPLQLIWIHRLSTACQALLLASSPFPTAVR